MTISRRQLLLQTAASASLAAVDGPLSVCAEPSAAASGWKLPAKRPFKVIENDWIPMRDGVRLAARFWIPEGAETQRVPVVWEYLPYRLWDDLRWRDDIAGDANHEQVAQTLVEDNLGRYPRVRAAQNDGEGKLLGRQFNTAAGAGGVLAVAAVGDETAIAVAQPLQGLLCGNHPGQCPCPPPCCQFDAHSPRLSESQPLQLLAGSPSRIPR